MTDLEDAFVGEVLEGDLTAVAVEIHTVVSHSISVRMRSMKSFVVP